MWWPTQGRWEKDFYLRLYQSISRTKDQKCSVNLRKYNAMHCSDRHVSKVLEQLSTVCVFLDRMPHECMTKNEVQCSCSFCFVVVLFTNSEYWRSLFSDYKIDDSIKTSYFLLGWRNHDIFPSKHLVCCLCVIPLQLSSSIKRAHWPSSTHFFLTIQQRHQTTTNKQKTKNRERWP